MKTVKCRSCRHDAHNGLCTARSGGTAYACHCSKVTLPICKFCGCRLQGVRPIKPFSEVYDRMCPERDGDMCEVME